MVILKMKKKVEKVIKKGAKNPLIVCAVFFLLVGVVLGIFFYNIFNEKVTTLQLNGEELVTLSIGETYTEEGATIIIDGRNYSDKVVVKGKVDTSKEGVYVLTYELEETSTKVILTRIVKVSGGANNE